MNGNQAASVWRVAQQDRALTSRLAEALGLPRIVAHLTALRGAATPEEAGRFLEPGAKHLAELPGLTGLDAAIERLRAAVDRNEAVLVYGDYDVDGISGTAILYEALRRCGLEQARYGLPSRLEDGYGLGPDQVRQAHENGVSLIVTVDNGINAREAAAAAQDLGVDLLVTDHHQVEGDLPEALAIVDPVIEADGHPMARACGAAVAFRLARALTGDDHGIDLAALGTVADIVPLKGLNRDIVAAGLDRMRRQPRPGLKALAEVAKICIEELTSENIAFQLGPRLNAAGRLADAETALRLLLTEDAREGRAIARALNRTNEERRAIERAILEDAEAEIEATLCGDQRSIVLARPGWHPGVIGIVAAQIMTRHHRPVVLIAIDEQGMGRGSARSMSEFDMAGALGACARHLVQFGGHPAAGGMSIAEREVADFRKAFEAEARRRFPEGPPPRVLGIDAQVGLSEIDHRLIRIIEQLQPFGEGNPAPIFAAYQVHVAPHSYRVLKEKHLKFAARQQDHVLTAIGFNMAEKLTPAQARRPIDIAFAPQFNTWQGQTSIQLNLKDLRPAQ